MGRYDHYPKPDDFIYRLLYGVLILSAIFCTAVLILIVINFAQAGVADPLSNKQYQSVMALARANPDNQKIIDQARDMDHLIRRAFFSNKTFRRTGAWMLFGGLIIFLASYKSIETFNKRSPFPGMDAKRDEIQDTKRGRLTTLLVSAAIAALALYLIFANPLSFDEERIASLKQLQAQKAKALKPAPTYRELVTEWPTFRGPLGWGWSSSSNLPQDWDTKTGKNIRWKAPVEVPGFNSPVVWKEAIYLSAADASGEYIYCFDREKGKQKWRHQLSDVPGSPSELPEVTPDTGYAAASLATDGRYVAGIFATGNIACLNEKGEPVWAKNLGVPENHYGHSSSLYLWQDSLLVQFDRGQQGEVLCLDIKDGKELWRTTREVAISWSSPILAPTPLDKANESPSNFQLILLADPLVAAYDVATGEELWQLEAISGEIGPSPAFDDGIVYLANEYARLAAIDIAQPAEIWYGEDHLPSIASPLAKDGRLILATASGSVACLDGKSGELLWQEDFENGFYASPVYGDGKVYLTDIKGNTFIFPLKDSYQLIKKTSFIKMW